MASRPYTSESPASALVGHQRRLDDRCYVLNHIPVLVIEEGEYELTVVDVCNVRFNYRLDDDIPESLS